MLTSFKYSVTVRTNMFTSHKIAVVDAADGVLCSVTMGSAT